MTFSPKLARIVRRALLTLAVLATVVVVAVVVENWRGDRAWAAYAAKAAARGEVLDAFPVPSRLPAARNFMMTPVLERWLFDNTSRSERTAFIDSLGVPSVSFEAMWRQGRRFDQKLVVGSAKSGGHAGAPNEKLAAVLAELREAAVARPDSELQRPEARTIEQPYAVPIPSFPIARTLVDALGIDASHALADGRSEAALMDVLAQLKLLRGISRAPDCLLLEPMIATALVDAALHPVWEGLDRGRWTDEQLRQLEAELEMIDLAASLETALESERTGLVAVLDQVSAGQLWFDGGDYAGDGERWKWRVLMMAPRGWVQQNKIVACETIAPAIEAVAARRTGEYLRRRAIVHDRARHSGERTTPYNFLALLAESAFGQISDHAMGPAARVDLARAACALERHRLARGAYPETLAQLVPEFLTTVPRDPIDGQPLRYRRLDDGSFVLYSIGLDGVDDGGAPIDRETRSPDASGDWCWPRSVEAAR